MNQEDNENSWISWFLQTPKGKYFIKIDSNYISDLFNLYGLRNKFASHHYKTVIDYIKGNYIQKSQRPDSYPDEIDELGIKLYGLIHSRFLMTNRGVQLIHEKYHQKIYERCPNINCKDFHCLPYGISEDLFEGSVYMFCPNCNDIYLPENPICRDLDGAFFGSAYIVAFLHNYPEFKNKYLIKNKFDLKLFGFKIEFQSNEEDIEEDCNY